MIWPLVNPASGYITLVRFESDRWRPSMSTSRRLAGGTAGTVAVCRREVTGNGSRMATDTETTERLVADRTLVAQYLGEAHAMEAALVTTLSAHLSITPPGSYRDLLERHLDETRNHAAAIERRLASYDGGESLFGAAVGLVETVVGQALTLAKGPIDMLRGTSLPEKLLKNAKDESAT